MTAEVATVVQSVLGFAPAPDQVQSAVCCHKNTPAYRTERHACVTTVHAGTQQDSQWHMRDHACMRSR